MITLAFYKASGDWVDRLIRTTTASPYSHCEMIAGTMAIGGSAMSVSASYRDGGVRRKEIRFDPGKWDLIALPWFSVVPFHVACNRIGAKYDLIGAAFTQLPTLRAQSKSRWFCSELLAWSLELSRPETLSPGMLALRLREMTTAYELGRKAA